MTARPNALATTLRAFFSEHLPTVRGASPHTIRSYRDSVALLLRFIATQTGRPVAGLDVPDLTVEHIVAFLHHREQQHGATATTRNVRLAALHAFARFLAAQEPVYLDPAQRILAIPFKRAQPRPISYLEHEEMGAVLASVDRSTRPGRRDYALVATMFNTGARVQEILDLRARDLQLTPPYQLRLVGKGRKVRWCPLWPQTARVLRAWCAERHLDLRSEAPVFINQRGLSLTRFGVRFVLAKHFRRAAQSMPSLTTKRLHPHCLRHSTAVHLLKSGVDLPTIAHWLGHASVNTTNRYVTVDLELKRKALARAAPLGTSRSAAASWRRNPDVLDWLEAL
ncbi:MAG: tyrosine-type recombinase/integrase [Candidatus Rokuibacteriota bacterium]